MSRLFLEYFEFLFLNGLHSGRQLFTKRHHCCSLQAEDVFLRRFYFAFPGLSFNPWSRKSLKKLQYLLQKGTLSKKFNIVIWHDIINITFTKHPSNNNRACRIDKLLSLIKQFKLRLAAIVYTARSSAPKTLEQLKNSQVVTTDIRNRLLSTQKRRDISIVEDIRRVHPPA